MYVVVLGGEVLCGEVKVCGVVEYVCVRGMWKIKGGEVWRGGVMCVVVLGGEGLCICALVGGRVRIS